MQPKSIILFFYGYILFFRRHKLIDEFHTKSRGYKWKIPIFGYLKNMHKDGEYFHRYYKNCKFFAIVD